MELEFDIQIKVLDLYNYLLYHAYSGVSAIAATAVGIFLAVAFFMTDMEAPIYIVMGVIFIFYLPVTLFRQSQRQVLVNPAFKKPLHCKLTEEGLELSQGEAVEKQAWGDMYRAVSTMNSILLYTSKKTATILPRKQVGQMAPQITEMICTHMPPKKVRLRGLGW